MNLVQKKYYQMCRGHRAVCGSGGLTVVYVNRVYVNRWASACTCSRSESGARGKKYGAWWGAK